MSERTEQAVLAGGCFWGMQDLIRRRPGVLSTRVGYTGGDVPDATYRNHGSHAEAIEITFDPEQTSYRDILEFFFQIHDPTTRDRQGNDVGTSYRSAIFYLDDGQRRVAEDTIADVEASGLWPGRVVTEVAPAGPFWEAEPEHQDYLERYPNGYTCHFPRPGWVLPRRGTRSHDAAATGGACALERRGASMPAVTPREASELPTIGGPDRDVSVERPVSTLTTAPRTRGRGLPGPPGLRRAQHAGPRPLRPHGPDG